MADRSQQPGIQDRRSEPRWGRPRDWLIGGLLLAAVVAGVGLTVGWGPLLAPWRELSPTELAGLFALTAASYVLRAVRVYDYFHPRFKGRFTAILRLSILHNTANNLLPMRTGEMVFPWLMGRYFGHGFGNALASLIWIRVLDLHFMGLVGLCVMYLGAPSLLWPLAAVIWVAVLPLLGPIARQVPTGRLGRPGRVLATLTGAAPDSLGRVARLYLWTGLSWTLKFVAFALVLEHFLPIDLWKVLLGVMGAELSSVLPFHGIAGSGSYELAAVAALVPFGVEPRAALAGAVNLHLFLLGATLLLGLLGLLIPLRRTR